MKDKLPKKPTPPKPHPRGYKPYDKARKENEFLRANWESSRPVFWRFQPSRWVDFRVDDKREMVEKIGIEEQNEIIDLHGQGVKKKQLCNRFQIPYNCLVWLLHERERDEFRLLRTRRSELSIPERMDRIVAAMVTELEDRMANLSHRATLETDKLVQMVKNASVVQRSMEEDQEDTGTVMTVVSHMPKKNDPDDGGGETVH